MTILLSFGLKFKPKSTKLDVHFTICRKIIQSFWDKLSEYLNKLYIMSKQIMNMILT